VGFAPFETFMVQALRLTARACVALRFYQAWTW
jgi:hypothetical protein